MWFKEGSGEKVVTRAVKPNVAVSGKRVFGGTTKLKAGGGSGQYAQAQGPPVPGYWGGSGGTAKGQGSNGWGVERVITPIKKKR